MKNVVVFGAEGLLGSDLAEMLQYNGVAFRIFGKNLCDVTNHKQVYLNLVGETTHLFNCAAFTNIQDAETNPKAKEINDTAVAYMKDVCLENKIQFINFSCSHVFDGTATEYSETDQTSPLSNYGTTKLAGEMHVLSMGDKGLVIRTNWLFGKYRKCFVNDVIASLEKKIEIELEDDEIGSPTYTCDLANAAIILGLSNKSGIYNVTNSGFCSKYELGLKIAEYMDLDSKLIKAKKSSNQLFPKNTILSSKRISTTLPEDLRFWDKALYQYLIEIGKAS